MITGNAHRQGGKNDKNFLQQLTIFPQNQFYFHSTTFKKFKFLFSFDSFKSSKFRAMRSKITKGTTMVTNNGFRSIRLFREGSSTMVLFYLQHRALRSYVTNHTTMMAIRNELRSTQFPRMRPKQRLRLRSLSLHFLFSFVWRNVH